ncbi:MAG: GntR family transcriptional regulator [Gemmatimonadaceae bacterium]
MSTTAGTDSLPYTRESLAAALAQRVSSGLHLGVLRFGERLPSTRVVAREYDVDPRVALAAYGELKRRGIVEMRTRSGIYVANPHAGAESSAAPRSWLIDVLADGISNGIPATRFADRIRRSLETLRLRATVLECNDDQLYSVSAELERDYGLEVSAVDIDSMQDSLPANARRADCVVSTEPHREVAREIAAKLGVPALVLTMCDDLFNEVRRLLPVSPVHFVVTDTRFESKLHRIFASNPGAENLRTLVAGRDDLSTIPADAPAYLTRLTRRNVGPNPLLERVIPESSVFSEPSARELLDFVIGSNVAAMNSRPSANHTEMPR